MGFVCASTHAPLQSSCPAGHVLAQAWFAHSGVGAAHAVVHEPHVAAFAFASSPAMR